MKILKPKFWERKNNLIALLLLPISFFLQLLILIKKKLTFEHSFKIPVICIGNIYLGGTGKTPSTIKIYKILKKIETNTVVGKKFYNNQVDEIKLLQKECKILTHKKRSEILKKAQNQKKKIIIFDDGLQDNAISYNLKIVCFDGKKLIGNGQLLPSGPLREHVGNLKSYDCLLFKDAETKIDNFTRLAKSINKKLKIFYTFTQIKNLKKFNKKNKYLIFSGIGNSDSFKNLLIKNKFKIIKEIVFPDHFNYNSEQINEIKKLSKKLQAKILTTEKDFLRINKNYRRNIDFVKIDLIFKNEKNFVKYLKFKIYEKN